MAGQDSPGAHGDELAAVEGGIGRADVPGVLDGVGGHVGVFVPDSYNFV